MVGIWGKTQNLVKINIPVKMKKVNLLKKIISVRNTLEMKDLMKTPTKRILRMISEGSSNDFYDEDVNVQEISGDDPSKGTDILK